TKCNRDSGTQFCSDKRQSHRLQQAGQYGRRWNRSGDNYASQRITEGAEFMLHTGDLTHLSDPAQFDMLDQLLKDCKTKEVFYVPGEHDIYDGGALYRERF